MAVAYLQQPAAGSFNASDTPILYVFSSTQTTQPNFCFIVETMINNTVVSTDMVFPERSNRAHWDASKITVSAIRPATRTYDTFSGQTLSTLKIRVSERYGTTPVTQTPVTSDTCKLLKASCDDETYRTFFPTVSNWVESLYTPSVTWLTGTPKMNSYKTMLVSRHAPFWASILNTDPSIVWGMSFYDMEGNAVLLHSSDPYPAYDKANFYFTPDYLNTLLASVSLTLESISEIRLELNVSDPLVIRFADEDCGEYHQLSWMNSLGTFDQFLFTHNREKEAAITVQEYKKQFGQWTPTNSYNYDDLTSGDTQYQKTISPTGVLYSGHVSETYQNWLREIYFGLDAILIEPFSTGVTTIERIVVTNTQATELKHRFEDTLNFQVNYKKTNFKSLTQ